MLANRDENGSLKSRSAEKTSFPSTLSGFFGKAVCYAERTIEDSYSWIGRPRTHAGKGLRGKSTGQGSHSGPWERGHVEGIRGFSNRRRGQRIHRTLGDGRKRGLRGSGSRGSPLQWGGGCLERKGDYCLRAQQGRSRTGGEQGLHERFSRSA